MKGTDAFSPEQLNEIRSLLLKKKRELELELRQNIGKYKEEDPTGRTDIVFEEGEEKFLDLEKEIDFGILDKKSHALKQVLDALSRLDEGDFGFCEACGQKIQFERLRAMPFAVLCRDCQQEKEMDERARGAPDHEKRSRYFI
jgi:DnaK suppressor protein